MKMTIKGELYYFQYIYHDILHININRVYRVEFEELNILVISLQSIYRCKEKAELTVIRDFQHCRNQSLAKQRKKDDSVLRNLL